MENVNQNPNSSSQPEDKWVIGVQKMLNQFQRPLMHPTVSICKITKDIIDSNPQAYNPRYMVLGPCCGLPSMNAYKAEAVDITLKRINRTKASDRANITMDELVERISNLDGEIRGCYEQDLQYKQYTLAYMLTVDGCFCLEFFRASFENQLNEEDQFSIIKYNKSIWWKVNNEIFMLQNQIPLKVLTTILQMERDEPNFIVDMVIHMLRVASKVPFNISIRDLEDIIENDKVIHACHLLDLYRNIVLKLLIDSNPFMDQDEIDDRPDDEVYPCRLLPGPAVELEKAGIKFMASNSIGKVSFQRRWFGRAILFLPKIYIDKETESLVRNLMAFEERQLARRSRVSGQPRERPLICNFMVFMDYLIDTERDVALLKEHNIINSGIGRNEELATIFNTVCHGFPDDCGVFKEIVTQVRQHYDKRVNKWCNYFREQYCATPWLVLSLLGAIIILLLTALQTVYTILQYYGGQVRNH